jgi:hypothetical protein
LSPREYSEARLHSVLEEIAKLRESDFPYAHSREALNLIEDVYFQHLGKLSSLAPGKDPTIVNLYCSEALLDIFRYIPLLGFILRSTNVRNAFEVHGPILRLCQQVVDPDTKLILSSEWDFSPFIFPEQRPLPTFVLIGLPAPETDNPLLLPLAGHELGHTIWQIKNFETKYYNDAELQVLAAIKSNIAEYQKYFPNDQVKPTDKVADLQGNIFVKRTIAPIVTLALARSQEYFCDCIGVYLFDEAFLYSFAYLVSPSIACPRPLDYPNNVTRIQNMLNAAAQFRKSNVNIYQVPTDFSSMFEDSPEPGDSEQQYLSSLADASSQQLCGRLIREAENLLKSAGAPQLELTTRNAIIDEFRLGVPACNTSSLTNILNAGWAVYNNINFWPNIKEEKKRRKVLGSLMIKNIELLEIEHRTR